MEQDRPLSITLLGIINIVFGAIGLLCNCAGAVIQAMLLARPGDFAEVPELRAAIEKADFLAREVPAYHAIQLAFATASILLWILLLVSGVGLLYLRRWGRSGSLIYGVLKVVVEAAYAAYVLTLEQPALARFQPGAAASMEVLDLLVSFLLSGIHVVYAIVLVALLLRPGRAALFAPERAGNYHEHHDGN